MPIIKNIADLPLRDEYAVIVNVGTKMVTTLAILSVLKHAQMPLVVVDCQYNGIDDYSYLTKLQDKYDFSLVSLPLRNHGYTLDYIFSNLKAKHIMLVDSDLEIRDKWIVDYMRKNGNKESFFGAGFYQSDFWFKRGVNWEEPRDGYYMERMWIPLTYLDVEKVREALDKRLSFINRMYYNIFERNQKLSRKLMYSPTIRKVLGYTDYSLLNPWKKIFRGQKPLIVMYDTGCDLYQYLKYEKEYKFAGIECNVGEDGRWVKHYSGITRKLLYDDQYNTGSLDKEVDEILVRMKNIYDFEYNINVEE